MLEMDEPVVVENQASFIALLDYLKANRSFDFTGYKHASLTRRIVKRMASVGLSDYAMYQDYLEVHPDEFAHLFNTILINVTSYFRDQHCWNYLASDIIPALLAQGDSNSHLRIWSAGCASGEEAYSLAMLLAEEIGIDQFRDRVKVYATDVDDEALSYARQASYTPKEIRTLPLEYLDRYFECTNGRYVFHKELRRAVIFGHHDLIQDAPISRIDLLVCRNALMYFNSEVQTSILKRLHFALKPGGYLFLGKAEMLFTHASLFTPVDLKRRIFMRINASLKPEKTMKPISSGSVDEALVQRHLRESVQDSGPIAQIAVDTSGRLAIANERARGLFRLTGHDLGRPLQDLELSYRPVELRSCIEQACGERRTITVKDVLWPPNVPEPTYMDVQVQPLYDAGHGWLGTAISYTDVTRFKRLQKELLDSSRELETAYEELQSTNEELETTNEELQSTVEELETTNEELQSTNEELETMNEELQSTNEELRAINDEASHRSAELDKVNAFVSSVLKGLRAGVVVVDPDLNVQVWNSTAEELWGLRSDEVVGKNFLSLDIGLPVDQLKAAIRACLTNGVASESMTIDARNRRGRTIQCKTGFSVLGIENEVPQGVILFMEDVSA